MSALWRLLLVAAGATASAKSFRPKPLSTTNPATFVRPTPRDKVAPAKVTWQDPHEVPKPTAEWWENMVLTKEDIDGNGNGFVIPYIVDPKDFGLKLAVPFPIAVSSEIYENGFDTLVLVSNFGTNVEFDSGYHVGRHDKLTVDLLWGESGRGMVCTLARGSPYVTCRYDGVPPAFNAPQMIEGFSVDGVPAACRKGNHTGRRFQVSFIQSDETWVLYTETNVTFACESDAAWFQLSATEPYSGTVRAAMANNCTHGRSAFHCNKRPPASPAEPVFMPYLDAHAHVYPVAADLEFSVDEVAAEGAVHYKWVKGHFNGSDASTPLLTSMMEHHRSTGVRGAELVLPTPAGTSIHGASYLATGDEWQVKYRLPRVSWHAERDVAPERLEALVAQLEADKDWLPPRNYQLGAGDPYNLGKMLSRMGRVALIAEHVGRDDIAQHVVGLMKPLAELYIDSSAANYLLYDHSWGGIVSCGCIYDDCGGQCDPHCNDGGDPSFCPSLTDPGMDFGNGYYNDHHFHYGYHLYAVAVLAHFDRRWAEKHKEFLLLYARDVFNPSREDQFFPVWRNKDWFMGFSWASGIALAAGQPFRNGRNQESTSESVNAYYALQLLGEALGNDEMLSLGRIATAAEIHSAQTYWHLSRDNPVYPPALREKRMLGILWQNLAQYQTWFGGQGFMVHGIQMIPITPISEALYRPEFIEDEYPVFEKSCAGGGQCMTDGWVTFAVMDHAILDSEAAWAEMEKLPDSVFSGQSPAGNGNSRSNTMYWIATRPNATKLKGGELKALLHAATAGGAPPALLGLIALVTVLAGVIGSLARTRRTRLAVGAADAGLEGGGHEALLGSECREGDTSAVDAVRDERVALATS